MANEIKFIVLGDVKDLESKLAGTKKAFDKVAKISAVAFTAMTASAYGFIEAAREQESAINQLNQALENQGNYSDAVSKELQKYASALQEVSLFGDETIIKAEAIIASFGFEGETLKSLTKATLDLAQAKGMDLSSAADLVAKSVGSSTNALARYGIQIDGMAGSSERAQSAVEKLNRLYGGQAEAATKGLGATIVLKNAMSDLSEEIGMALAPKIEELTVRVKGFVDYLKANPEFAKMAADFLVLGIQITAAVTAFAILGGVWARLVPIVAALGVQVAFLGTVSMLGLNTSVGVLVANMGLLYPAIMLVGAGFAGWNIGKWISDVTGLSDAVGRLGEKMGELRAQQTLGDDYISEEEFNAKRLEWAAQAEAAKQREIETDTAVKDNKISAIDAMILKYDEYQNLLKAKSDIDIVTLQQQLQKETDLTKSFEQQKTVILQNEIKARTSLQQSSQNVQLAALSFAQEMTQAFGKESKAAFYILKAIKIGEILVNSWAATMAIQAAWAWNPPVNAALQAQNRVITALSLAGVVATTIAGSFAAGSPNIPGDMVANVHKGETIIPATFSEAIREGDLTLSGAGGGSGVTFDFSGSQFNGVNESSVREWFQKASEMISNRTLSPLPAV